MNINKDDIFRLKTSIVSGHSIEHMCREELIVEMCDELVKIEECSIDVEVDEIICNFQDEDFLSHITDKVQSTKKLNKKEMIENLDVIIQMLDEVQSELNSSSEYACDIARRLKESI